MPGCSNTTGITPCFTTPISGINPWITSRRTVSPKVGYRCWVSLCCKMALPVSDPLPLPPFPFRGLRRRPAAGNLPLCCDHVNERLEIAEQVVVKNHINLYQTIISIRKSFSIFFGLNCFRVPRNNRTVLCKPCLFPADFAQKYIDHARIEMRSSQRANMLQRFFF